MGAPYLGPEGGRPGRPTQVVRHACSGNLGIVQLLRYIRSAMYTAFFGRKMAPPGQRGLVLKHNGKSGTAVIRHDFSSDISFRRAFNQNSYGVNIKVESRIKMLFQNWLTSYFHHTL